MVSPRVSDIVGSATRSSPGNVSCPSIGTTPQLENQRLAVRNPTMAIDDSAAAATTMNLRMANYLRGR